jgi:hypothetical protein
VAEKEASRLKLFSFLAKQVGLLVVPNPELPPGLGPEVMAQIKAAPTLALPTPASTRSTLTRGKAAQTKAVQVSPPLPNLNLSRSPCPG